MASPIASPSSFPSPNRLWAEQLAAGLGLFLTVAIFLAIVHPKMLTTGAEVLGPNDLEAYGYASVIGILAQIVLHELGTLIVAWRMKLPLRFRFFGFGANAAAILEPAPRRVWVDAVVGFAGPITGSVLSLLLAGIYDYTGNPFFLGMACVGYFYNLITLIPILDMEGGWIAPAIAPQAWLIGLMCCAFLLANVFNLVLLGILCFGVPRFVLILRARAPRTDTDCTQLQRVLVPLVYFVLVLGLAYFGTTTYETLPTLVRDWMGD